MFGSKKIVLKLKNEVENKTNEEFKEITEKFKSSRVPVIVNKNNDILVAGPSESCLIDKITGKLKLFS
jgi:peptidyl-tRNA hydrolase